MSEPIPIYWAEGENGIVSQSFDFGHLCDHPEAHFELHNKKDSWLVLFMLSPTTKIKIGWAPTADEAKEKALHSFEIIKQSFKIGIAVGKKMPNDTPEYH